MTLTETLTWKSNIFNSNLNISSMPQPVCLKINFNIISHFLVGLRNGCFPKCTPPKALSLFLDSPIHTRSPLRYYSLHYVHSHFKYVFTFFLIPLYLQMRTTTHLRESSIIRAKYSLLFSSKVFVILFNPVVSLCCRNTWWCCQNLSKEISKAVYCNTKSHVSEKMKTIDQNSITFFI